MNNIIGGKNIEYNKVKSIIKVKIIYKKNKQNKMNSTYNIPPNVILPSIFISNNYFLLLIHTTVSFD